MHVIMMMHMVMMVSMWSLWYECDNDDAYVVVRMRMGVHDDDGVYVFIILCM